jgi:hypothetical protein
MQLLGKPLLLLLIVSVGVSASLMLPGLDDAPGIAGSAADASQARQLDRPLRKDNVNEIFRLSQRRALPERPIQSQLNSHYADLGSSAHAAMIDQNDLRIAAINLSYR